MMCEFKKEHEESESESAFYERLAIQKKEDNKNAYNGFVAHFEALRAGSIQIELKCDGSPEEPGWVLSFSLQTKMVNKKEKIGGALYQGTIEQVRTGFKVESTLKIGRGKTLPALNVYVRSASELLFMHQRMSQFRNTGLWLPYWLDRRNV